MIITDVILQLPCQVFVMIIMNVILQLPYLFFVMIIINLIFYYLVRCISFLADCDWDCWNRPRLWNQTHQSPSLPIISLISVILITCHQPDIPVIVINHHQPDTIITVIKYHQPDQSSREWHFGFANSRFRDSSSFFMVLNSVSKLIWYRKKARIGSKKIEFDPKIIWYPKQILDSFHILGFVTHCSHHYQPSSTWYQSSSSPFINLILQSPSST